MARYHLNMGINALCIYSIKGLGRAIIAEGKVRKFVFWGRRGEAIKVFLPHNLKCFLTMEVNVSAMKLSTDKSIENTVVVSSHALRPSLHFLTWVLQTAYFKSYF